jgi:serine/threonine protein kinase
MLARSWFRRDTFKNVSLALPDAPSLRPGNRLDRYELLCPIAHGGMASVWIARTTGKHGFEKLFAIKTILPEYAHDLRFQQMFLDEARIASNIDHPNVAHIIDLGEENDTLYLVMEWIDGDSLSKLNRAAHKKGKRLPVGVILRILADVSGGLHAAHQLRGRDGTGLGVVHRDVSPQNILITSKGTAKLIDFGVAKARDRVAGDTSAGQLKGKIHYMAPEQALGRSVDRRADVWSVGAVAYHLLSGVPPFDGANELATLHMLTSGKSPPPLPDYVPIAVADPIFRALVDSPTERISSALDLQRALEQAMIDAGVQTSIADVADLISEHLGDRIEARRKAIEQALVAASERVQSSSVPPLHAAKGGSASGVDQISRVKAVPTSTAPGIGPDSGEPTLDAELSGPLSEPGVEGVSSGVGHAAVLRSPAKDLARRSNRPEFAVDFDAPGSMASNATLGSAASEIQWPPPGAQARSRRWAAWGTLAGLLFGIVVLVLLLTLRAGNIASSVPPATPLNPPAAAAEPTSPASEVTQDPTQPLQPEPPATARPVSPSVAGTIPPVTISRPPVHPPTGGGGGYRPQAPKNPPPPPKPRDYGF